MTKLGIIKLSREMALKECAEGGKVFMLDLDDFQQVYEVRYMVLNDIFDLETRHTVIYFEVVPDEN